MTAPVEARTAARRSRRSGLQGGRHARFRSAPACRIGVDERRGLHPHRAPRRHDHHRHPRRHRHPYLPQPAQERLELGHQDRRVEPGARGRVVRGRPRRGLPQRVQHQRRRYRARPSGGLQAADTSPASSSPGTQNVNLVLGGDGRHATTFCLVGSNTTFGAAPTDGWWTYSKSKGGAARARPAPRSPTPIALLTEQQRQARDPSRSRACSSVPSG